jgi:hypothetical protein
MNRIRRVRAFVAIGLVLGLVADAAWAMWSTQSVPGGNGAAEAAMLNRGATPTAVSTGGPVTVSWAATTLSTGAPAAGYIVNRYDATTLAPQTVATACDGVVTVASCTESTPAGQWVYSVTPIIGTQWIGAESERSNAVTTESTSPVNAISASAVTGNIFQNGNTIFYRGSAGGSLTLTNVLSDSGSGPASSATASMGSTPTGWTHTPSSVSVPSGGPYVSNPFSWSAASASTPTEVVTGRDVAGNIAATTLSFVNDSTAPTAGTISYPNGYQPAQSVVVTLTTGTDSGSGIATRQIQRSQAVIANGSCGAFSGFADVGPDSPPPPYTDTQVLDGYCYQYRYVVTDQVGNQVITTSAQVAKVDSSAGALPLSSAGVFSVLGGTAVTNTATTDVSGDLGVSPSSSVVGFPPGVVAGTIHAGDATAAQAQADLVLAYNDAAARTPTGNFAGDQNGATFHPGVYHTAAAFALTGVMTLNGDGDPNALFVFQVDAALNTAAASQVNLINGAVASQVFWQVNGAADTGALSTFSGTIMAAGAITLGAGSQLIGRALAYGTVTLASNTIRFTVALPPTVTIDDGATAVTKDATPTLTGTSTAAVATTVTVRVSGQVLTTAVQTDGTWNVTAADLNAGRYNVVASVRDPSGNAGTASQTLTVEINPDPVVLGQAATYSVLGTGVTNTGVTLISGDLGVSPGDSNSGLPPVVVGGSTHLGDAAAASAHTALVAAYNDAASRTPDSEFAGDLNGRTFHAGTYHTAAALALTGTVTLDGEGVSSAIFIFQVSAALNTAAASQVSLINGAQASHVFWQVVGASGTGALSTFAGTIMSVGAITLGAGAQLAGRALSYGTVTLANNIIS